jgi:histidinol dehydrogenase
MKIIINPPVAEWESLCSRPLIDNARLEKDVREIMENVRRGGDKALREYTRRFDGADIDDLRVPDHRIASSVQNLIPGCWKQLSWQ